jgi:NitT/TauT family transport system substrate-binding protein
VFQGAIDPYLAEALGEFKERSLTVEILAVPSTSKALEALMAGSADAMIGTYEQSLQAPGVEAPAVLDTCHCLGLVTLKPEIRSPADLAGRTIGVAGFGGPMQNFARHLLAGDEASYAAIGVGPSSAAALEQGRVDVAVVLYTTFQALKSRHPNLRVLAETFTRGGMKAALGVEAYPAKSLLARQGKRYPELVAALLETNRKMRELGAERTLALLPPEARGPDPAIDRMLLELLIPYASLDGAVPPGAEALARKMLARP